MHINKLNYIPAAVLMYIVTRVATAYLNTAFFKLCHHITVDREGHMIPTDKIITGSPKLIGLYIHILR